MAEQFKPTHKSSYRFGKTIVEVQVENSRRRFAWRIVVDGEKGPVSGYYQGVYCFKGFCIATAYYEGSIEEFIPFQLSYGEKLA